MTMYPIIHKRLRHILNPYRMILLTLLWVSLSGAQTVTLTVTDTVIHTLTDDFHGIQYHAHTYDDPDALSKLEPLQLKWIRFNARIADFYPEPGVWHWTELDTIFQEILAAGYQPMVCLFQSEAWYTGSASAPWWNDPAAVEEWEEAARRLAERYRDHLDYLVIFDEPNYLHPEQDYYISFRDCARLYIKAAEQIKQVDHSILCGGPSGFGGWENGHWADYVLDEPGGSEVLDFISCNIFLSWDPEDTDETIMSRTIWYEEAPMTIRERLGERVPPTLILDAYNASALWKKDGELWTDPRNTGFWGGIYQAAALMHSAKGGYDITLRWETIGGYGILSWYPAFEELPPYHAWRFLITVAGLTESAQILECTTTESPREDAPHHGGMSVDLYTVQPFAIRRPDGGVSLVLINKYADTGRSINIEVPEGMSRYTVHRYDREQITGWSTPVDSGKTNGSLTVDSPGLSVTVVRFERGDPTAVDETHVTGVSGYRLYPNHPNPCNPGTIFTYDLSVDTAVRLEIYNMRGEQVAVPVDERQTAGRHSVRWDGIRQNGQPLPSGLYLYRLHCDSFTDSGKMLLVK